jgi:peptidyl-prolyl cis-trans isomerase C
MRRLILLTFSALAGAIANAQEARPSVSDIDQYLGPGEVALVNGQRLPESVFRLFTLGMLQANPDALTPEARTEVINRLINTQLLAQEAERNGLHRERRIAAELELQRLQVLSVHMSERIAQRNPPTDAELREIYEQNLPLLQRTEYKSRHILVASEQEARDILEELDDGEDFAELAIEHSTDPSGEGGGDLGWLGIGSTNEPFAAAIIATTPGTYNPTPVQTEFGWHVVRVDETRQSEPPTMQAIQQDLITAYSARKVAETVQALREAGEVELVD